jgi:hypothetical protein
VSGKIVKAMIRDSSGQIGYYQVNFPNEKTFTAFVSPATVIVLKDEHPTRG